MVAPSSLPTLFRLPPFVSRWVRRVTGLEAAAPQQDDPADSQLIYRLRAWPELEGAGRTAPAYRMLSLMSQRPLNRQWIIEHLHMPPTQVDALLAQLVESGAVEVIDAARFRAGS